MITTKKMNTKELVIVCGKDIVKRMHVPESNLTEWVVDKAFMLEGVGYRVTGVEQLETGLKISTTISYRGPERYR